MTFDAFSAGVSPGGLRNKNDIKLLICYLLSSVNSPISKDTIVSVLQNNNFANYFEINSAFSDLLKNQNIREDTDNPQLYNITETGRIISSQLDSALPLSIRDKALYATVNMLSKIKRETENTVSAVKDKNGYQLKCNISGGDVDLLSFSIYVPDEMQANLVKKNFQENPNLIYECVLAILTKDEELVQNILLQIKNEKNT